MKISYNWLKTYINIDLPAEQVAEILTFSGLEVESWEEYESVKGGLKGIVIGKVLTREKHPNADKLSLTTVDTGGERPLNIVCGAPNVAAGQTVLVATIGTRIYSGNDSFEIKESKIRGEKSEGMICAEDELGLGNSHDGIMVLPDTAPIGTLASEYFNIYRDIVFEIGLTPNRVDASSHYGVARDLYAVLKSKGLAEGVSLMLPDNKSFAIDNQDLDIPVVLEDPQACPRYSGVTISGITVAESPDWLRNYLNAIGLRPINNVVDITNFVLFESGQPLHAFDASKIKGNKIVVKCLPEGTPFTTLDGTERKLGAADLMICNEAEGMCIGGVYGGLDSGVSFETRDIFLESAYFSPSSIRKTSKLHGLKTDASFRFERGVDPENTVAVLKRAAVLIREIAGGKISSSVKDEYPAVFERPQIELNYQRLDTLIGKSIERESVKSILKSLEIEILKESEEGLDLRIPLYRVDVTREADVVEEILRIYGYNNIALEETIRFSMVVHEKPEREAVRNVAANMLTGSGFNEIMNNSLTRSSYKSLISCISPEEYVHILNPLSKDLEVMRPHLIFGGLETIQFNQNRRNPDLKLFEFGNIYRKLNATAEGIKKYQEEEHLSIFMCGEENPASWNTSPKEVNLFSLKAILFALLGKSGIPVWKLNLTEGGSDYYGTAYELKHGQEVVAEFGEVSPILLKAFDIKARVYASFIRWNIVYKLASNKVVKFTELPKYPEVRRDLALLVKKEIRFAELEKIAYETEKQLLQRVGLFDIYSGDGVAADQKSYAMSFVLRDEQKTLTDTEIDAVMKKLILAFETKLGAVIRK